MLIKSIERLLVSVTASSSYYSGSVPDWDKQTVEPFNGIVTQLDLLRLVSDFSEVEKDASDNLIRATSEILNPKEWLSLRIHLYKSFIPTLLVPLAPKGSKEWVAAVVRSSCDHADVADHAATQPCAKTVTSSARKEKSRLFLLWLANEQTGSDSWVGATRNSYTLGDARAFANAVQIESKTRNPSWLLDAFVQAAFRLTHGKARYLEDFKLKQPWIRPYFSNRAVCVDRLLEYAGKTANEIRLIRKYAAGGMDGMFDLAQIDTVNKSTLTSEELSALVTDGVKSGVTDSDEVTFIVSLIDTFILNRIPTFDGKNDTRSKNVRNLIHILDVHLDRFRPSSSSAIVTSTSNLRLVADFFGTPETVIAQAVSEALSTSCSEPRRYAYRWFIPGVLREQLLRGKGSKWVVGTAQAAVESDWSQVSISRRLTGEQHEYLSSVIIKGLLLSSAPHARQLANDLQRTILPQLDSVSEVVDRLVLAAMKATISQPVFSHDILKRYVAASRQYVHQQTHCVLVFLRISHPPFVSGTNLTFEKRCSPHSLRNKSLNC